MKYAPANLPLMKHKTPKASKSGKAALNFRVPIELLELIDRHAAEARRKRSDFLRILIEDALTSSACDAKAAG